MATTTIDEIQVLIRAQSQGFQKQIDNVNKQLSSIQKTSNSVSGGVSAAFSKMKLAAVAAVAAIGVTIGKNLGSAISRLDTLSNFPKVMANLGVSATDAQKSIDYLNEKLLGLPTTIDQAALSVQQFTSVNNDIKGSTAMFLAMNNAILAGGASSDVQRAALEQLSQAYAKGKADAEEWRAMLTAMPAQMKQIANAMGYSSAAIGGDLQTALQDGKVSMNDFMSTAIRLNQQGYGGFASFEEQARTATGGVATSITNMKTAVVCGIATIMQQIGQSNIASFFSAISKAIGTASNYIAAFVRIVKEAVAWVQALFGKSSGSTNEIVKSTGQAGSNVNNIASGAKDAAGGLDKASGAAKKLNKQLASFDEMNVLSDKDTSGSGDGGSGSGGSNAGTVDTGGFNWDNQLGESEDKIKELAERMKSWLQDAFNLDWDTIGAAMVRFWDDLKAGAQPIAGIIGDIWNDYIRPLVTWAGNSLLPAVLNAIGGAIRFVGAVLGETWNIFLKPFIDAFLVPIAKWTGGVIVSVLNKLGDTLRSIAQNQNAVRAVAAGLTALGTVIAASKLVSFFGNATSAIKAFSKGAASFNTLKSVIGTPLATITEMMLGTTNATTGLAGGIKVLSNGGMSGLATMLGSLKGAFSALWGVISAHPIGAIIAVVAALLLTNEDLRNSLGNLLNAILKPLGSILNSLIDSIEPILSIAGSLLTILGNLIGAAITPLAKLLSVLLDAITPVVEIFIQFCTPIGLLAASMKALQPILKAVADALSWVSDTVSGAIGIFSKFFGSSEKAGASAEKLKETNDKLTESAKKYNDALDQQVEAQKESADVALSLMDAQDKLAEKNQAVIDMASQIGQSVDLNSESYKKLADNLSSASTNAERAQLINQTFGTSLSENDPLVQQFSRSVLEQASATQGVADAQQAVTDNQTSGMDAQETMTQAINDQVQALKDAGLSSDQMNQKLEELKNDGSANSVALRDEIIKNADQFGLKWDDTSQKMVDKSNSSRGGINQAFSDVGSWFGQKFEEAKNGMKNAFSDVGKWAGDRWNDVKNAFNNAKDWFKDKFSQAKDGISEGLGNIRQWGEDRWNDIQSAFNGAKDKFKNVGNNIKDGLSEGIGNMGKWLKDKFNGAVESIKNFLGIHSPSRLFKGIGSYMSQGMAIGFDGNLPDLVRSTSDMASQINQAMDIQDISLGTSGKIKNELTTDIASIIKDNPIALTVNLGNEKLIDQTINGINERSFLSNSTAINI
ncbi:MAG: tape measure protein [Candidatus Saccharibacteria bacterium]|nr:tape measure protein [Candidatus Saccharibacteria bacterium]